MFVPPGNLLAPLIVSLNVATLQDEKSEALHQARAHEKLLDYAVLAMHEGSRGDYPMTIPWLICQATNTR